MTNNLTRRSFIKTSTIISVGIIAGCSLKNRFDVIIKNGLIIDGSGSEPYYGDIGIIGDRIKAIEKTIDSSADLIIDAKGYAVSPGFIDIHTHTDMELLVNFRGESKVRQGVTTEIGGNCGSSPFPLNEADFKEFDTKLYERYGMNATWRDLKGFFDELEKRKVSINFGSFVGNGDLRAYAVGRNNTAPAPDEMKEMKRVLAEMMEQGSLGLSSGLEYAPSSFSNTEELIELSKVVSSYGGIYNTHMRNEDDTVEEAIIEAIKICREADIPLEIAHLKAANPANWHKADKMLRLIEDARSAGLNVNADRYPYIAYGTGLSTFIPIWARQGSTDEIIARLESDSDLPKIKEYALSRGNRIGGWDRVSISYVSSEKNKIWEGKFISECAENSGKDPFNFIKDLLIEERLSAGIVGFAMDENNLKKVLSHELVMIGSDGNATAPYGKLGKGKPHPRFYGTFPRVLGKYSRDEKLFDIQTAVKKMTSMPADKLGLNKRGRLNKDYFADIVIFNPSTVNDKATFTDPHQYPVGIDYVLVNGVLTIEKGKHTDAAAGRLLRKNLLG